MEIDPTSMDLLVDIAGRVINNGNMGDIDDIFVTCCLQHFREKNISKESAKSFCRALMWQEDEYNFTHIFDKGKDIYPYKLSELSKLCVGIKQLDSKFWESLQNDVDQVIQNMALEQNQVEVYETDTNTYLIIDHNEKVVYEEHENPRNRSEENNRKLVLGAIPTNITVHKNPLLAETNTYSIDWEIKTNELPIKMREVPISQLYEYLQENQLILNHKRGKDVVSLLFFVLERNGKIQQDYQVTKPGIYWNPLEQEIITRDLKINTQHTYEDEEDALDFVEQYARYFTGHECKLGTILKWGWIAPYSFAIKQLEYEWLPWMYLYGKAGSGKTEGYGYPTIYMYDYPNETINNIGGSSIDTVARLGYKMEQGSQTILVNEPGAIFNKPSTCDMLKNCVTSTTGRGKFTDKNTYSTIPAYSIIFFTGNHSLPNDESLRRRFIILNCSHAETTRDTREMFQKEMKPTQKKASPLNKLKIISGYILTRIKAEPDLLSNWKYCIDTILTDLWKMHGREIPEWLKDWEEAESPEDMDQEKRELIKEGLHDMIISAYTKVTHTTLGNIALTDVLDLVIDSKQIPWLNFKNRRCKLEDNEIAFSTGFVRYINKLYAEEETVKSVSELLGWNYARGIKCFNSQGLWTTRDELLSFLFPTDSEYYYKERYPTQSVYDSKGTPQE